MLVKPASGNEHRFRAGVGKNVFNLVQRLGGVDRNVDRAETQDREVGDRPLGSILRKQGDAVSRSDAETRQAQGNVLDALDESRGGDVVPLAVSAVIQRIFFVVTGNCAKN